MEHILINKNVLKQKLENYDLKDIDDLNNKKNIINNWVEEVESKRIEKSKEESLQGTFLKDIFETVLGYTSKIGNSEWNLEQEMKTRVDSKKADGALGFFKSDAMDIHAVIELKDAKTNLDLRQNRKNDNRTPIEQAFDYANKSGKNCKWVIVSNFKEIRLYDYDNTRMEEYHLFNIKDLKDENKFKEFYYLLCKDNLINESGKSNVENLFNETLKKQDEITDKFYNEYKKIRLNILKTLKEENSEKSEFLLLEKAQKLLDRFLFIYFAEDKGILPANIVHKVSQEAKSTSFCTITQWYVFKYLFNSINNGDEKNNIFAYNGGLFKEDKELDELNISDSVFEELVNLSDYDFEGDLNVNILGHIFEQSISDLEEIKASIEGEEFDISKGKRKKDGVYYTPEYITRYIVEQTVGGWLEDRKKEIGIEKFYNVEPEQLEKDRMKTGKGIELKKNSKSFKSLEAWKQYKEILKNIKIVDPACGSGAFLIQALNYLVKEGNQVNKIISYLQSGYTSIDTLKADILKNNLYGVDLNSESVEITKLSLWLNSVERGEKLTTLDQNIKCGNSLIDDVEVAGDKAFKWGDEFKEIFENGGFDIVIGNPPYGAKLNNEEQKYLVKKYIKGGGETAISFLKFSNDILKDDGYLGFIIPKSFIFASNYQNIRQHLKDSILEIVDCKKVWKEVKLEQCIVSLKKNSNIDLYYTSLLDKDTIFNVGTIKKSTYDDYGFFLNNITNQELDIANNLNKNGVYLNDIATNSRGGIFQKHISEKGDFKVLGGAEIQRTGIIGIKGMVYTQYVENDDKSVIKNNSVLVQRIVSHIENPKDHIKITACLPESLDYRIVDTINQITVNSNVSNKVIWLILNSKLVNWYAYRFIFAKAIRTMQFDNPVTKRIPIPKISEEQQKPLIEKADLMLKLNKDFQKEKKDFFKILEYDLKLNKISKKLDNFNELDFKEFVKELKKQKITIAKRDIPEYNRIFEDYKNKLNQIKSNIDSIDSEINKMVYELYELTNEEIELIENSI
ncbi:hypothetical protein J3E07_001565 [Methanococcus voltae]|uniref:site-specific DNA-methyltransferase (adenine-specific) n=1 Tax=Methanococcus voltae TaxID=2188 RepID=A0A8J7RGT7_METVO|nr:N-6 DNA methylase [Methanococcus voltae]MBP2202124.1 hypothetical protein [Methanococcus voltae]